MIDDKREDVWYNYHMKKMDDNLTVCDCRNPGDTQHKWSTSAVINFTPSPRFLVSDTSLSVNHCADISYQCSVIRSLKPLTPDHRRKRAAGWLCVGRPGALLYLWLCKVQIVSCDDTICTCQFRFKKWYGYKIAVVCDIIFIMKPQTGFCGFIKVCMLFPQGNLSTLYLS